jgi:hypothetical protein
MNTELQNIQDKFEFKQIDFNSIRLEPQYLTKYGKHYHELYNQYKNITREEYYKKYKNNPFVSFWDNDNEEEEEQYYSPLELDNLGNYDYQPINNEEKEYEEIQQIAESSDSEEEFITL